MDGHLVSCFPHSLASEICLSNLNPSEKEGYQRGDSPLSSLGWASHVQNMPWCRTEGQPESPKPQMLWEQEVLTQSGPLLCGTFKNADTLMLCYRG